MELALLCMFRATEMPLSPPLARRVDMTIQTILQDADHALAGASSDDQGLRLEAMKRFMCAFYDLAREIHAGNGSWDDVRPWAGDIADRVRAARAALGEWQLDIGRLLYSPSWGEEDIEIALERRSQHAFAREAFRDTPVDELLAGAEDAEVDQDFHDRAEGYALDAPSFVPASHTWWHRRSE
jgi:hypothetical protein